MKIVYCIPSCYNSGGMERVLSLKANYLADKVGYEVYIVTTGQKGKEPYYSMSDKIKFIDLGINYDEIESLPIYIKFYYKLLKQHNHRKKLEKTLFQLKADIVISMFTHEMSFLYKIKDGSAKVLEIHFSKQFRTLHNYYNHVGLLTKVLGFYLNYRDCVAAKKYDRFVVLTQEDKLSWKGFSNIKVIYNPMTFEPQSVSDYKAKSVIAVGRLCAQKGFDMLIDIWSRIDPILRKSWTLSIYGSGPDYDLLNKQINDLDLSREIKLCSPTNDIANVYKHSSILCFTSRYEGFSMALIESFSFGITTVSFDCPCGPSDIIENGVNGFLIKSFDCDSFALKLSELMKDENKRKEIGEKAFETAQNKFRIEVIMQQWVNLFLALKK